MKKGLSPKRSGDIEVFVYQALACATAKIINKKEDRIKNNKGIAFDDDFKISSTAGRYLVYYFLFIISSLFF
ncbi:MAG: hypothetical protein IJ172_01470 [Ruminococcus sp.]|nr:hypothetical protein [Ruminococcus sp.]